MQGYKDYFKGKKITIMGLGLIGKGYIDPIFLAQSGADIIATDLKTAKELAPTINKLKKFKNIKFVLGEHRFQDFENRDFILKNQGIPLDSPYIRHARKAGIPIEMDESLFMKLAPAVTVVGVTGTRGKTTTTYLIYEILSKARKGVHIAGNLPGKAALPLLAKVTSGDIAVFELSSWQLQGFGDAKISPHIAVFTNLLSDHLNYYKNDLGAYFDDKANIYKFQKPDDLLVAGDSISKKIGKTKSRKIIATEHMFGMDWAPNIIGKHNRINVACAILVARHLGISDKKIRNALAKVQPVEGRLQFIKKIRGISIYNDNNATTPEATVAALEAFGQQNPGQYFYSAGARGKKSGINPRTKNTTQDSTRSIILIMGGADKGLETTNLVKAIKKYCKKVILLPGTGTDKLSAMDFPFPVKNLKEAVEQSIQFAKKGDTILFSPAFASFGLFKNEYDRNDQFMALIKKLK